MKNSYNWCMWGEIGSSVTFTQNGKVVGSLRYDARVTLIAHSFTGERNNNQARQANQYKSRQFKVFFYVDEIDRDGKSDFPAMVAPAKAAADTFPFNLGLAFNPSNKCVPLADRVVTALARSPAPAVLAELRAEVRRLGEDLLAQAPPAGAPPEEMNGWHPRYVAVSVLEAALQEDAMDAAWTAVRRVDTLRLGDREGRRMGTLREVLNRILASTS
ncbi:hypothetical protein [Nonomuraea rosea]|uniref:hypothetical protein n=1 Tax=Nonomuraea rosea TaxID=638574 RepID=UPI0031EF1014